MAKLATFLALLLPEIVLGSRLEFSKGAYSKLTVNIEEQKMPENCQQFFDKFEVRQEIEVPFCHVA